MSAVLITNALAVTVEEFGQSVAYTLQDRDGPGFSALVDDDSLIDRAMTGIDGGNKSIVAGLRTGLARGLSQVGTVIVNNMGPEVRMTYLRSRNVEQVQRVLLRVDLGERGINYLDFFVRERPDGSLSIFDWLDYAQGQTYSDSLRKVMALMMKEQPSLVSKLLGLGNIDTAVANKIAKMGNLGQEGDWAGWLETYRTLPENVRNSRVMLSGRIAAASMLGDDDEYMNAMADLHANHGDDPTLSLALLDYHLVTGDYTRAYRAVDRLDEYTGGDAALTNLRSGIALHEGDNAACIRHARRAISQDADYEEPYWNLMLAGSRAGNYEAAMEAVRALEMRFGYGFSEEELMASEDFSGLVTSQEWESGS